MVEDIKKMQGQHFNQAAYFGRMYSKRIFKNNNLNNRKILLRTIHPSDFYTCKNFNDFKILCKDQMAEEIFNGFFIEKDLEKDFLPDIFGSYFKKNWIANIENDFIDLISKHLHNNNNNFNISNFLNSAVMGEENFFKIIHYFLLHSCRSIHFFVRILIDCSIRENLDFLKNAPYNSFYSEEDGFIHRLFKSAIKTRNNNILTDNGYECCFLIFNLLYPIKFLALKDKFSRGSIHSLNSDVPYLVGENICQNFFDLDLINNESLKKFSNDQIVFLKNCYFIQWNDHTISFLVEDKKLFENCFFNGETGKNDLLEFYENLNVRTSLSHLVVSDACEEMFKSGECSFLENNFENKFIDYYANFEKWQNQLYGNISLKKILLKYGFNDLKELVVSKMNQCV